MKNIITDQCELTQVAEIDFIKENDILTNKSKFEYSVDCFRSLLKVP